jgi:hypothetical protein
LECYIEPNVRDELVQMADTTESWLYDEGEDCKKNEYVEKLQQLQVGSNDILLQCYLGKVLIFVLIFITFRI